LIRKAGNMNINEYICPSISLVFVGVVIYGYIAGTLRSKKNKKIFNKYKHILDDKLIPLHFKYYQEYEDARERTVSYRQNNLEVTLYFGPPSFVNVIYAKSGNMTTLEGRINQMSPKNKAKFGNEQNRYRLVDALDFRVELSEVDEAKAHFLETLEKWLTENQ